MTVIAFDGKSLAADRRECSNHSDIILKPARKLIVTAKGACATTGDRLSVGAREAMIEAIADGKTDGLHAKACAIVLLSDGRAFMVQSGEAFETGPHALGSGHDIALTALHMGADARRAAEVACELSAFCGDGVDVYTPGETE